MKRRKIGYKSEDRKIGTWQLQEADDCYPVYPFFVFCPRSRKVSRKAVEVKRKSGKKQEPRPKHYSSHFEVLL